MAITIQLPAELEEQVFAEARERGVSVDEYLRALIVRTAHPVPAGRITIEEYRRLMDEAASFVPLRENSLPAEAFSREKIYTREDDWK